MTYAQVFCDQTHMPLDLDTRSRTIALAVSLCFAVLVLRFDDTRFPLPLLTQIQIYVKFIFQQSSALGVLTILLEQQTEHAHKVPQQMSPVVWSQIYTF